MVQQKRIQKIKPNRKQKINNKNPEEIGLFCVRDIMFEHDRTNFSHFVAFCFFAECRFSAD